MNTNTSIIHKIDYKTFFKKGISYSAYKKNFEEEISIGEESPFAKYLPQNFSRQSRLDRKLKLTETLSNSISKLNKKQKWLVITEHWCGDASQINPIINKVAQESNGWIDLHFIYRDENPELMDAHLTDGRSKSIPILIQMDESFNLMATYGPRPADAQAMVKSLLSRGETYDIPLHTWYAKDKQKSVQSDISKLLEN